MITLTIDGNEYSFAEGMTVAAAILSTSKLALRTSVTGEPRAPLCGTGTCFECRVTIDGLKHQRSCTPVVENGMEVVTLE